MSRYHSYLKTATDILIQYQGEMPLAAWLKKYFARHKKHGSRDRRQISHLCYCFFRLGKAAMNLPVAERVLLGLFLTSTASNELLQNLSPGWNEQARPNINDKLRKLESFDVQEVFPWKEMLSATIDHERFCSSFFSQPDLFLRLRPGNGEAVRKKLREATLPFEEVDDNCFALVNAARIDSIIDLNREAVVQDRSSQRIGELMKRVKQDLKQHPIRAWDCCAASGGKSIMAIDILGEIGLTVSDLRESILANLEERFAAAGIKKYEALVADLSKSKLPAIPGSPFDLVIADVPCTGSGTWGRTPEQLYYFDKESIHRYASLQKKIVSAAIPLLKPRGYLLYSTCSVFREENEAILDFIAGNMKLEIVSSGVLKGYDERADTMFAGLLHHRS